MTHIRSTQDTLQMKTTLIWLIVIDAASSKVCTVDHNLRGTH